MEQSTKDALQENQAIVASFLRRMQKLLLYVTYCGAFLARRCR